MKVNLLFSFLIESTFLNECWRLSLAMNRVFCSFRIWDFSCWRRFILRRVRILCEFVRRSEYKAFL